MKKVWALMWYGVDESAIYGIVTSKKLAKDWESRGDGNQAVPFDLNLMPKMERWRDEKMFPHAPGIDDPMTAIIKEIYSRPILEQIRRNMILPRGLL